MNTFTDKESRACTADRCGFRARANEGVCPACGEMFPWGADA